MYRNSSRCPQLYDPKLCGLSGINQAYSATLYGTHITPTAHERRHRTMTTILIIDDDKNYREGLIDIFNLEHYTTLEAENGLFGLQVIHAYSPNLILCDMDMPVMNGMEVLRSVKADPKFSMIPFIIVSGRHDERRMKLAQGLGVTAYLVKTIDVEELLKVIVQFLKPHAA